MKTFRLLSVALLLCTAASAQDYSTGSKAKVFLIGEQDEGNVYEFDSKSEVREYLRESKREKAAAMQSIVDIYEAGFDKGYQSALPPILIIAQRQNKFSFGIGGFVQLRTSYDFNGTVDNIDFVTYDIPTTSSYDTRQSLRMDASTSRLFFKGVANTRTLGKVDIFIDTDFRGGAEYSYTPRLRNAYVSFWGITAGRTVTTFSDPMAAPRTIDFQGPNAYCFNYATLIRYQHSWVDNHLTAAIALEQPNVSGTYGDEFESIPQRVPDIPFYLQYQWGMERESHVRLSGVFRDMYAYSVTSDKNTTQVGWGVQISGRAKLCHWVKLIYSGILGEGITPYIQDLMGSGLDFTPKPTNNDELQATPMYSWQAAAEFDISPRISATGGYSTVTVDTKYGYYSDDEYKKGQYIFGNVYYAVTPRMQIACEYIYGKREDMDYTSNSANRASVMLQYHF